MTDWPSTLPSGLEISGYQEPFTDSSIKSSMDAGPPKRRRRFSASIREFSGNLILTGAEVTLLETFYYDTIKQVSEFNFIHPRKGTTVVVVFSGAPSVSAIGPDLFQVGLKMEIQP